MKQCILTSIACLLLVGPGWAQGTAFTYQGRLNDSNGPVTGLFDFEFRIFDAAAAGTDLSDPPVLLEDLGVTNGLFTASLSFEGAFTGADRFLEISVRPASSPGAYTRLSPRQPVTSTPYALRAKATEGLRYQGANQSLAVGASAEAMGGASLAAGAGTLAGGDYAVALGDSTFATGHSAMSVGLDSLAAGAQSFAGGTRARAQHDGAFVWADGQTGDFTSTGPNQFLIRAEGGVGIGTGSPQSLLHVRSSFAHAELSLESGDTDGHRWGIRSADASADPASSHSFQVIDHKTGTRLLNLSTNYAVALGTSRATNVGATAAGSESQALGAHGTAMGGASTASGFGSTALGYVSVASGDHSTAMGTSTASGHSSTAMGFMSTASGSFSMAVGNNNVASGNYSVALGAGAQAAHAGTFVWADTTAPSFSSSADNQFLIRAAGGVGIGTGAPATKLHVSDTEARLRLQSTAANAYAVTEHQTDARVWHSGVGGSATGSLADKYYLYDASAGQTRLVVDTAGNVGIGTSSPAAKLHVAGNLTVDGTDASVTAHRVSLGWNNTASGSSATALGLNTTANGDSVTALGEATTATGYAATAMGSETIASGTASTAMGRRTTAAGGLSTALGHRARANHSGSLVWADAQDADFASTAVNQFSVRAQNGVVIQAAANSTALELRNGGALKVTGAGIGTGTPVFIHRAAAANIESGATHRTTIDHPLCNGDPNAMLIVTQNYNAQNSGNVTASHSVGVYYNPNLSKWQIFHQNIQPIEANTAWNVLVVKP